MKFILPAFILLSFYASAYDSIHVDLSKRWKTFSPDSTSGKNVQHLKLKQDEYGLLIINSSKQFSLLINNQLMVINKMYVAISLDSLKSIYTFPIDLTLFSKDRETEVFSEMIIPRKRNAQEKTLRPIKGSSILLSAFILFWILILLFYGQRAVTIEYFKFPTLFSIRNQDDNIQTQRITSFSNLFVYIFCSILIAVNLVAVNQPRLQFTQFTIVNILIIFFAVLAILFLKIVIVSITAYFFGMAESAPNQFFSFVKLLLTCFLFSSACLILGFIFNLEKNFLIDMLKTFTVFMLAVYLLVTFLRLNNKGESTVFHLFSYLCISEIFPMLLLLKIYYF